MSLHCPPGTGPGPFCAWFHLVPTVTPGRRSSSRPLVQAGRQRPRRMGGQGDGQSRAQGSLTRADVQALAVLFQPLDALLQLALQGVVEQQLLTLEGVGRLSRAAGPSHSHSPPLPHHRPPPSPPGAAWLPAAHTRTYSGSRPGRSPCRSLQGGGRWEALLGQGSRDPKEGARSRARQGRDEKRREEGAMGSGRGRGRGSRAQDSPQTCHLNADLEAPLQPPQRLCVFRGSLRPHFLQPHPQLTQSFPEQPGK